MTSIRLESNKEIDSFVLIFFESFLVVVERLIVLYFTTLLHNRNMRVVLIGAGISGGLISLLLRRQFGPAIKLVVFDKGRNIGKNQLFLFLFLKVFNCSILGGRMTTAYDSEENTHCSVDTGAQYLTLTKSNGVTTK